MDQTDNSLPQAASQDAGFSQQCFSATVTR